MSAGAGIDNEGVRGAETPLVFVSDPTAEAERVAQALRNGGYIVVDVPLSMLVARVAVQHPRVVLVDADSHGALEVVARMHELPQADDVQVVFVAAPGGTLTNLKEALAHEGCALFLRPVDVPALVQEVDGLSGGAREGPRTFRHSSTPPPSIPVSPPKRPSAPPSRPSRSFQSGAMLAGGGEPAAFSEPAQRSARLAFPVGIGVTPPLSAELQRLLADAEDRVPTPEEPLAVPSPEEEIEAVLPADLLAALDKPIEEDDEADAHASTRSTAAPRAMRERTTDGGPTRTPGAATIGGATPDPGAADTAGAHATGPSTSGARPTTSDPGATPGSPRDRAAGAHEADSQGAPAGLGPAGSTPPDRGLEDTLGSADTTRRVGRAIARRTSGSLCLSAGDVERRIVLREGDIVTCVSTAEDESLIAFLGARGDLPRETVRRLVARFAPFGRHAGAALVARGYLLQDQMWPTLRAHAEWVLGRCLQWSEARIVVEVQAPGRLAAEPSVFGGATGAEVFVEIVRRIVTPQEGVERLGGATARVVRGPAADILDECRLRNTDFEVIRDSAGRTLAEVLDGAQDDDFASTVFALAELGVVEVLAAVGTEAGPIFAGSGDVSALDADAIRERVRARLQLVEDGDYFAVLGVPREATGYDVRRAFLELRRAFDPSRLLSREVADLADDVRVIATVLDEAYEILKDSARRERYRRAIEVKPE